MNTNHTWDIVVFFNMGEITKSMIVGYRARRWLLLLDGENMAEVCHPNLQRFGWTFDGLSMKFVHTVPTIFLSNQSPGIPDLSDL